MTKEGDDSHQEGAVIPSSTEHPRQNRTVSRGKIIIRPDGLRYQNRVFSETTSSRVLLRRIASQTKNKAWLETVDIVENVADSRRTLQIVRWRARSQKESPQRYWRYAGHFNVRSWPQWYAATQGVEKWLDRVETLETGKEPRVELFQTDLTNLWREKEGLKTKIGEARKLQEFQRFQLDHMRGRIRRMRQHIGVYRKIVQDFQRLVTNPTTTETQIHQFIYETEAPWLFGLEYVSVESKVRFPPKRNTYEFDLMLQRYDGFNDLVELKGPNEQLFIPKTERRTAFSQKLSEALGQSMVYLAECDKSEDLRIFRPRAIIVIGNENTDDERQRRMVTSHFARIEVLTYSDLVQRTKQLLEHLQGKARKGGRKRTSHQTTDSEVN